jgi:hypothetical protein
MLMAMSDGGACRWAVLSHLPFLRLVGRAIAFGSAECSGHDPAAGGRERGTPTTCTFDNTRQHTCCWDTAAAGLEHAVTSAVSETQWTWTMPLHCLYSHTAHSEMASVL